MFESSIPQNDNDLSAEKGPACDVRNRLAVSAVYDVPAWGRSSVTRAVTRELADVGNLPGAERISADHLSVWRYGERGYGTGRKSGAGKCHGQAGVWSRNTERDDVVQSCGVCGSAGVFVWECREELGCGAGNGDAGYECVAGLCAFGTPTTGDAG